MSEAKDLNTYMNKEDRTKMGELSLLVFGSKGKWLKLQRLTGNTLEEMQTQMNAIKEEIERQLNERKK